MPDFVGVPNEPREFFDVLEKGPRRRLGAVVPPSRTLSLASRGNDVIGNHASGNNPRPAAARMIANNRFFQPEPTAPPASRSGRTGVPRQNGRRRLVVDLASLIAAAGVALIAVLVAPWNDEAMHSSRPPPAMVGREPNATATVLGGYIDSVGSDSEPVRPGEFFREAQVTVDGHTYTRVAQRLDSGCPDRTGAASATLAGDLCRQLARAVYLSDDLSQAEPASRPVFAAIAVAVTDNQATAAQAAAAASADAIAVRPLELPAGAAPDTATINVNQDYSWDTSSSQGHYLILIQAAYADGGPPGADEEPLRAAANDLRLIASRPIEDRADFAGAG